MYDILVAGQIVADVLVRPVERVDFTLDTQRVDSFRLVNGGDAMNVAVDLAKLGSSVAFCGRIGADGLGRFLLEKLEALGVEASSVARDAEAPTATCLCLINRAGERCFFYCGGANDRMRQEDVTDAMLKHCRAVHVGGTFLLPGMDGDGTAALLKRAHAAGCRTSMDVTWDTTGRWNSLLSPCYPSLDLFMPSLNEARCIAGTDDPAAIADYFLCRGVRTVVVKLGARGCYVREAGQSFYGGIFPVPPPVDTTGAGDAFAAGFLHAGLRSLGLRECAKWGAAAAARAILEVGATDGVPGGRELEAWMKQADYQMPMQKEE
jgi:sugar/nucleoside kinase (ribokinase family)